MSRVSNAAFLPVRREIFFQRLSVFFSGRRAEPPDGFPSLAADFVDGVIP